MLTHRLIRGGEHWLPFAESKLRALKKLGLWSASQSFTMPDGALVRVRLVGATAYIEIGGGGTSVYMDSGGLTFLPQHTGFPGYLLECGSAAAYNSSFQYNGGYGRIKTAEVGSSGQFSGDLTIHDASRITGRIVPIREDSYPADNEMWDAFPDLPAPPARCASPAWEKMISPVTGETTYRPRGAVWSESSPEGDELLANRRRLVEKIPASIFTGRMRLYVQAIYGRPLYVYGNMYNGREYTTINGVGSYDRGSNAPGLEIPMLPYKGEDGAIVTPEPLKVDTSTGVYLHPASGTFWLTKLDTGKVYPLKTKNASVERMRPLLIPSETNKLSTEDREHIEAYILSYSYPDESEAQDINATPIGTTGSAMGYGWHWNFSGTTADIVVITENGTINGSIHYRCNLTIAVDESTGKAVKASASVETVTKVDRWSLPRHLTPVARPDYLYGLMTKATLPSPTIYKWPAENPEPITAPFYVFYKGDELVLCNIHTREVAAGGGVRTASPGFCGSLTPGANDVTFNTKGLAAGYYSERVEDTADIIRFEIGPLYEVSINTARMEMHRTGKVYNKTPGARKLRWNGVWYAPTPVTPWQFGNTFHWLSSGTLYDYYYEFTWDVQSTNQQKLSESVAEVAIPFYDSEAISVHSVHKTFPSAKYIYDTHYRMPEVHDVNTGWLVEEEFWAHPSGAPDPYLEWTAQAEGWFSGQLGGIHETIGTVENPTDTEIVINSKLICKAGVIDHKYPTTGYQLWHIEESDIIECRYDVRSNAASASAPVVFSNLLDVKHNTAGGFYTTVGWV